MMEKHFVIFYSPGTLFAEQKSLSGMQPRLTVFGSSRDCADLTVSRHRAQCTFSAARLRRWQRLKRATTRKRKFFG